MDAIVNALASQVPDLVVLLIIVFGFLRHLERRDAQFTAVIQQISAEIKILSDEFKVHAQLTEDGIHTMQLTVAKKAIRKKAAAA